MSIKTLLPSEEHELQLIINEEDRREKIRDIMHKYSVEWETIKDMILASVTIDTIDDFCKCCYSYGYDIVATWNTCRKLITSTI